MTNTLENNTSTTTTDFTTCDIPLPSKAKADKPTFFKVSFDPKTVLVPKPAHAGQMRVKIDDVSRHALQIRNEIGSEMVDESLIRQFFGQHKQFDTTTQSGLADADKDESATETIGLVPGQDIRFDLPIVFRHKKTLTWGKGHRRCQLVRYLQTHAPAIAALLFPDGTILVEVIDLDPMSEQAVKILDDHSIQDERRKPLLIETYDRVKAHRASLEAKGLAEVVIRSILIKQYGRETTDKIVRLDYLPSNVTEVMRSTMTNNHADLFGWGVLSTLYKAAQDHTADVQFTTAKDAERDNLKKLNPAITDAEITIQLAKIEPPEGREKVRPDPENPGPEFLRLWAKVREGKADKVARSVTSADLTKIVKSLHLDLSSAQGDAIGSLLGAIASGDYDKTRDYAVMLGLRL